MIPCASKETRRELLAPSVAASPPAAALGALGVPPIVRQLVSIPLTLALAAYLHVDWHFARPMHHRLSLDWSSHWIACAAVFALAGWYIARRWPGSKWKAAGWNVAIALLLAQVVEPLLETAYYDGQLLYDVERARWVAFGECVGAGVVAMGVILLLVGRATSRNS